tara:strand:- start:1052 stop:1585 length:534 start_codon:yes stop_codon:yes gene_type:complete
METKIVDACLWVTSENDNIDGLRNLGAWADIESAKEWGVTKFVELFNAGTSVRSWVAHCPESKCSDFREWTDKIVNDYMEYYELQNCSGTGYEEIFKVAGTGYTDYLHLPDRGAFIHTLTAVGPSSGHGIRVEKMGRDISLDFGDFVVLPPDFPYDISLLGSGSNPSYFLRRLHMQR